MGGNGRWVKGQSGNPKGRPKGFRAVIDVIGPEGREQILLALKAQALAGDVQAARVLLDRTDATLARQELTGADGEPIAVESAQATAQSLTPEHLGRLDEMVRELEPVPDGETLQ